ncbi:MAG: 2-C-methyl-D-erythritol 4-phosphate cytidylyltransferase [Betaproteobacteria bacterium]|nr:2-C-methyl-D-erythritol 4-phosphate cytidylyltransferase [Betaproteobacteria bacterium]
MQLYGVEIKKIFELTLYALIPAAGVGARMRGEISKQYLPLAGRPMLWHAVKALCVAPIENVFVVLAPDDQQFAQLDWSAFAGRLEPLYCGGAKRRDTVLNGMLAAMAVVDTDDWLLVHDAARPCLPRQDLLKLIRETGDDKVGGILALRVTETVKRAVRDETRSGDETHSDEGAPWRISGSEDRNQLWLAQTPQMFRCGLLLEALQKAKTTITDEAGALEQMGLHPRLVTGSRENIKVTFAEDLKIAEAILGAR